MPYEATVHNIFIASPGDVQAERTIARDVIYEWNAVNAVSERAILQPIGWETHSFPDMGDRAQGIINRQILGKSDILVAIFWYRLGTATGVAEKPNYRGNRKSSEVRPPDDDLFFIEGSPAKHRYRAARSHTQGPKRTIRTVGSSILSNTDEFRQKFTRHLAARMVEYLKSQLS